MPSNLWTALLTSAIILLVAYIYGRRKAERRLPPGPRPLPLIGNVLDFPRKHLGREFRELSHKHGDVVYLNALGQSVILLGSYDAANEYLEKRSSNNSGRPLSIMVNMTGLPWILVFKQYDSEWRHHRRAIHSQFLPSMLTSYEPIMYHAVHVLLNQLLTSPENFSLHSKMSLAAAILRITYGKDIQDDRRYYDLAERIAHIAEDISTPGRHPVEAFPSMQALPSWFLGTGFKKLAEDWKAELCATRDELFYSAKDDADRGATKVCVITRLLDDGMDEETVRDVSATIYAAGADTTNTSVHAFFLAMALNPQVQKRAQEELDAQVGPDRLPQYSDQASLPYVNALIKELVRWHVAAPIGVPHRSVEDDEVDGYFIPGGSIVIGNAWAMSRDETMYPDPERFFPERFLKDGVVNPEVRDPMDYVFGFGRRICPGQAFASASLFVTCASILHTFEIAPPLDANSKPKVLDVWMGNDLAVSHPEPFECRIVVRDAHKGELIRAHLGYAA